jgi:hypothetical protein
MDQLNSRKPVALHVEVPAKDLLYCRRDSHIGSEAIGHSLVRGRLIRVGLGYFQLGEY